MDVDNVIINEKVLRCLYCENNTFSKEKTLLNKRLFSVLDMEWLNILGKRPLGTAYICKKCGFKHEFFSDMSEDRTERMKEFF